MSMCRQRKQQIKDGKSAAAAANDTDAQQAAAALDKVNILPIARSNTHQHLHAAGAFNLTESWVGHCPSS